MMHYLIICFLTLSIAIGNIFVKLNYQIYIIDTETPHCLCLVEILQTNDETEEVEETVQIPSGERQDKHDQ